MNDELQKQIAAILKQALEAAQHGGQWLAGQIPDVLHQLLLWNIAIGAICLIGLLLVVVGDILIWRKAFAYEASEHGDGNGVFAAGVATVVLLIPLLIFASNTLDGLKALVAPKLFLLEYAAHLVK